MKKPKRVTTTVLFSLSVLMIFCAFSPCKEAYGTVGKAEGAESQTTSRLLVEYDNGFLTISAAEVSLLEILKEISQRTGAEFVVRDETLSSGPVSLTVKGLSLSETIPRVLSRYSYVLEYTNDGVSRILILGENDDSAAPADPGSRPAVLAEKTPDGKRAKTVEKPPLGAVGPPPDKCRELWTSGEGGPPSPKDSLDHATAPVRIDEILARAATLLATKDCLHLWDRVLEGLTGIYDVRVTTMLEHVARSGANAGIRSKAAEVLWHNTARSGFYDVPGIQALERLSNSKDEGVSLYARRGLEDYRRYIEREKSGPKELPTQEKKKGD